MYCPTAECEGCQVPLDDGSSPGILHTLWSGEETSHNATERMIARVFRAGACVRQNVFLRDMNLNVPAQDSRHIEVLAHSVATVKRTHTPRTMTEPCCCSHVKTRRPRIQWCSWNDVGPGCWLCVAQSRSPRLLWSQRGTTWCPDGERPLLADLFDGDSLH